ncbi:mannitol dehydrogenase family protein [Pseudarthrobacter niigatensis]|uniref:Mannitol-1-phosphate 5-dehydrogenase n=1 Tax=Pseudarthrobacter niigatensis TaxID=369935 RepID=A0AAJ1SUH6_9MICC|nr:mannitol dehydrogenase family protein [Pseudarthrobacter niigatensis]MDQ0147431.1 fructuronate reductase [Pseudarthrobacter niigatensis]MDQ0267429.1 fructuronate reductase [Pseudarthrobacter niigatensis]
MNAAPLALNRSLKPLPKPPVRIVHLGLGAFHRSHQAWYTQHAPDAAEWGIAAFTGRRPDAAAALSRQDCLYTLVERSAGGDSFEVIGSIVEAVDGANTARLCELVAAKETAVVTLTITEAAYGLAADGTFDAGTPGAADDLRALSAAASGEAGVPGTPLGRLVLALARRRDSGSGPIAVVSCDNLSANGEVARRAVLGLASGWGSGLAGWIEANVSFVSTSVDRITPRTTEADIAEVEEQCGYSDNSPVVAEPFRNWVLSGDFPAGRPRWEEAGAVVVGDIEPYENRKLWLLNGSHSILAYAGQLRGHATVADALADPLCRKAVEDFWDEAAHHLQGEGLDIPTYRRALLERFGNERIAHRLAQIAADATTKLRMRAVPVMAAERADGRSGAGSALMLAAWIDYVTAGNDFQDPLAAEIQAAVALDGTNRVQGLLRLVSAALAEDPGVVALVSRLLGSFATTPAATPAST